MSHIFISYSKQDIDFVRYLRAMLEAEGFAVWLDEARLTPSARWWKSIETNIETCSAFIVVMSPNAEESDWVEREILLAERLKKPLFPMLLAGSSWSRLANIQYEDMRAGLRAKLTAHLVESLKRRAPSKIVTSREVMFSIETGDVTKFEADVLAFKYARTFHGADEVVANLLARKGIIKSDDLAVAKDEYRLVQTEGAIPAASVVYVGTTNIFRFGYEGIRDLARRVLEVLAEAAPQTEHLAMTLHGPSMGLDEAEAFFSQFAGYRLAMLSGKLPTALKRITIVERDKDRVVRLRAAADKNLSQANYAKRSKDAWGYSLTFSQTSTGVKTPEAEPEAIETAGTQDVKPHAFVALPPHPDMDDIFFYGIQTAIHARGLLCERMENDEVSEDWLAQIRQRIDSATVMIADLTNADPLVFLQVGYALGRKRPLVMLAKEGETIPFASQQPPFFYKRIKDVEAGISQTLTQLDSEGKLG